MNVTWMSGIAATALLTSNACATAVFQSPDGIGAFPFVHARVSTSSQVGYGSAGPTWDYWEANAHVGTDPYSSASAVHWDGHSPESMAQFSYAFSPSELIVQTDTNAQPQSRWVGPYASFFARGMATVDVMFSLSESVPGLYMIVNRGQAYPYTFPFEFSATITRIDSPDAPLVSVTSGLGEFAIDAADLEAGVGYRLSVSAESVGGAAIWITHTNEIYSYTWPRNNHLDVRVVIPEGATLLWAAPAVIAATRRRRR